MWVLERFNHLVRALTSGEGYAGGEIQGRHGDRVWAVEVWEAKQGENKPFLGAGLRQDPASGMSLAGSSVNAAPNNLSTLPLASCCLFLRSMQRLHCSMIPHLM